MVFEKAIVLCIYLKDIETLSASSLLLVPGTVGS